MLLCDDSFHQKFSNSHRCLLLPEVTEENAEAGLSGAASGAEVATAGASGEAGEATGEDTAQERWTPGEMHSNKNRQQEVSWLITAACWKDGICL